MALVRGYPGECLPIWDYRYESPRADLRGFQLERLAVDPVDAQFERERSHRPSEDIRSDRILPNGARFYNDHGHPEYSTPECWSLRELALHDRYGESVVLEAANALARATDQVVTVYKNNTDFHGASYGTHESYLVPRATGFDALFKAVTPMLIARQILTGAGKVGSESGDWCDFQLSQRADFFSEAANAETLFRRPVFNTRDEAHADPAQWIRLHMISGDANMMPACTARKVGLVKLALLLLLDGEAPIWQIKNPVRAFQDVSRDSFYTFRIELEGRNWTTAYEILESYLSAAERTLDLDAEMKSLVVECRTLLGALSTQSWDLLSSQIDWAAKKSVLQGYLEEEGGTWKDSALRSFDLEYHNVDPDEGLFHALESMESVPSYASPAEIADRACGNEEGTRALARAIATTKFRSHVRSACWRTVTFEIDRQLVEVELRPELIYERYLNEASDVGMFVRMLRGES